MKVPCRTLLLVSLALVVNLATVRSEEDDNSSFRMAMKLVEDCNKQEDIGVCLKLKAVSFLDRMARAKDPVPITEYLALAKEPAADQDQTDQDVPKTESELEASLPRSLEEKSSKLDDLIWNKVGSIFSSRSVQFTVPTDLFEGRKSGIKLKGGKKGYGVFVMAAMMGGMMMKMAMGKIALIAGKALLVGKIALVLAVVLALKKFSGGGGGGGGAEVVYATAEHGGGGGGGGGWQRRYRLDPWTESSQAQHLAYSAYEPDQ